MTTSLSQSRGQGGSISGARLKPPGPHARSGPAYHAGARVASADLAARSSPHSTTRIARPVRFILQPNRAAHPVLTATVRGMDSSRSARLSFCRGNERANQGGSRAKRARTQRGIGRLDDHFRRNGPPQSLESSDSHGRGPASRTDATNAKRNGGGVSSRTPSRPRGPGSFRGYRTAERADKRKRAMATIVQRTSWRRVAATNPLNEGFPIA